MLLNSPSVLEGLVAKRLRKFSRSHFLRADQRDELTNAALAKIKSVLLCRPETGEAYLCGVADRVFSDTLKRDRCIVIPDSTRRRRIKRGDPPGDFQRHSWSKVFDARGDLRTSDWSNAEQSWFTLPDDTIIRESLELIIFLCNDALDRQIVLIRWDDGRSINSEPIRTSVVADQLGVCERTVRRRLRALEERYYKYKE